jgi:hypothetical protein
MIGFMPRDFTDFSIHRQCVPVSNTTGHVGFFAERYARKASFVVWIVVSSRIRFLPAILDITQTFEVLSLTSSEIMVEYSIAILLVFCCLVFAPPTVEECVFNPIVTDLGESRFAFLQVGFGQAGRLVNMPTRARRLKTQARVSTCLQVIDISISCQRTIQHQKNCSHYT